MMGKLLNIAALKRSNLINMQLYQENFIMDNAHSLHKHFYFISSC